MEQVKRIVSALILVPPLVFFLLYASPLLFLILILVVIGLSLYEYFRLLPQVSLAPCTSVTWCAAFALAAMAYLGGMPKLSLALFGSIVALTLSVIVTKADAQRLCLTWVYSVFGLLFIGWTLSHCVILRLLPVGPRYIVFLCVVVWIGDSVAMYVGKSLGRHQMAPAISPGKTWEGACGGVIGSVGAAVISAGLWLPHLVFWQGVILGLGIALTAQTSDLGESILKRYAGVKDSGRLIPGHGGILDRIDSLLFAAPTLVYTLHVLLPVHAA